MNKAQKLLNIIIEGNIVTFKQPFHQNNIITNTPISNKPDTTLILNRQAVDDGKTKAMSRDDIIKLMESLKTGDKVKITYKKFSDIKTQEAIISKSYQEVRKSYQDSGNFLSNVVVYIAVKKGGGLIKDYGDKYGVMWQPTMLTQVEYVLRLDRI